MVFRQCRLRMAITHSLCARKGRKHPAYMSKTKDGFAFFLDKQDPRFSLNQGEMGHPASVPTHGKSPKSRKISGETRKPRIPIFCSG